jgi:hypothetical protein
MSDDDNGNEEQLATLVEDMLLHVLVEANYDVDAALKRMDAPNSRTLRRMFEVMKDAMENKQ